MAEPWANAGEITEKLHHIRQARLYKPDPVPEDALAALLQIARWTGSSRNTQPWYFIVVTDKEKLRQLSTLRTPINWVADAPLGIALVMDGKNELSESYDEGRVTERLMIGAHILGLGGGIAWFGDAAQQQRAKEIMGVPADRSARSIVIIGYPTTTKDHRPNPAQGGRRPLNEIVSYNTFGASQP